MKIILLSIGLPMFLVHSLSKNYQIKNENIVDFYLEIKQNVSGSYTQNTFLFDMDKFFIYESKTAKKGQLRSKKIYSRRVKPNDLFAIKRLSLSVLELSSNYTKAELGGVRWEINLTYEGKTKQIFIESYSVKAINQLFEGINKIIPRNKPIIYKYE